MWKQCHSRRSRKKIKNCILLSSPRSPPSPCHRLLTGWYLAVLEQSPKITFNISLILIFWSSSGSFPLLPVSTPGRRHLPNQELPLAAFGCFHQTTPDFPPSSLPLPNLGNHDLMQRSRRKCAELYIITVSRLFQTRKDASRRFHSESYRRQGSRYISQNLRWNRVQRYFESLPA